MNGIKIGDNPSFGATWVYDPLKYLKKPLPKPTSLIQKKATTGEYARNPYNGIKPPRGSWNYDLKYNFYSPFTFGLNTTSLSNNNKKSNTSVPLLSPSAKENYYTPVLRPKTKNHKVDSLINNPHVSFDDSWKISGYYDVLKNSKNAKLEIWRLINQVEESGYSPAKISEFINILKAQKDDYNKRFIFGPLKESFNKKMLLKSIINNQLLPNAAIFNEVEEEKYNKIKYKNYSQDEMIDFIKEWQNPIYDRSTISSYINGLKDSNYDLKELNDLMNQIKASEYQDEDKIVEFLDVLASHPGTPDVYVDPYEARDPTVGHIKKDFYGLFGIDPVDLNDYADDVTAITAANPYIKNPNTFGPYSVGIAGVILNRDLPETTESIGDHLSKGDIGLSISEVGGIMIRSGIPPAIVPGLILRAGGDLMDYVEFRIKEWWNGTPGSANGRFVNGRMLSWIGEDGPEVVIPLSSNRRSRGLDLWQKAGDIMGVGKFASGKIIGNDDITYSPCGISNGAYSMKSNSLAQGGEAGDSKPSDVNVNVNPVFRIDAAEKNAENMIETIKAHMKELAEQLGGEVATSLRQVF